ncbi:MAG: hypothetical protein EOO75_09090, partial [Myxococcales bacterium]
MESVRPARHFDRLRARPWFALGLGVLTLSCAGSGEGGEAGPGWSQPGDTPLPTPTGTGTTKPPTTTCESPDQGCPCETEGATADCAETRVNTGTYVSCAHGTRLCQDGAWGACRIPQEAQITSRSMVGMLGLGSSTKCTNNPCDPYCSQVTDDAEGLDAGVDSGLVNDGGSLTLDGQPAPDAGPGCTALVVVPGQVNVSVKPGPTTYVTGGLRGNFFDKYSTTSIDPGWEPTGTRVDPVIDYEWTSSGPGVPGIGTSNYSVRWEGRVKAPVTGLYTFETLTDDGARLWVNNQLLVDKWITQGPTAYTGTIKRLNPVTNAWVIVAGSGTTGSCVDGTIATSCNMLPLTAFVDANGSIFFNDRGRIRTIIDGKVVTLMGQSAG